MTLRGRLLFIPLLVGLLTGTGAWAQGPEAEAARAAAKQAASKADTEEALALLKGMLHYLEGLSRFAFVAHTAYDAVQETGQELEFGGRRRLLVRRPDRMRVEVADRDGERATLFFDGERISVDLPVETAYAQVDKRGTLDEAIDYSQELFERLRPRQEPNQIVFRPATRAIHCENRGNQVVTDAMVPQTHLQPVGEKFEKIAQLTSATGLTAVTCRLPPYSGAHRGVVLI